ncbi:ThiJ/PfpI family protein [Penicillium angulare]|uniref:ThiJ/PfpI family protein n=1 Tax=Penicillium angulare TaxID=116970 RepID=UPI00253FF842|nr:ThiJ/PfpI family protein [Penicillium angulare]KAJ5273786.1 ThiJ/PfpI family protein [Penicillium angulare]
MSDITPKTNYKVAVLIYEGVNVLDFTGPMQVLSHASHDYETGEPYLEPIFETKTIAQDSVIHTANSLTIEPDITLEDARDKITEFDILIIPGASMSSVQPLIDNKASPEVDLIRCYTAPEYKRPRMLLSVSTGAFLLCAAGILPGLTVTTHYQALNTLKESCCGNESKQTQALTKVIHRRFVDAGVLQGTNVRIITAGGISASIDAAFYILCKILNPHAASRVSRAMEYGWTEQDVDSPLRSIAS